jgi:hypothetical protein
MARAKNPRGRCRDRVLLAAPLSGTVLDIADPVPRAAQIFASGAPDPYLCHIQLSAFTPAHIFVLASGYPLLESDPDLVRHGTTGAEFRIDGLPASQFIILDVQPGAGGTIEGDFFCSSGGIVSFSACRAGDLVQCPRPLSLTAPEPAEYARGWVCRAHSALQRARLAVRFPPTSEMIPAAAPVATATLREPSGGNAWSPLRIRREVADFAFHRLRHT